MCSTGALSITFTAFTPGETVVTVVFIPGTTSFTKAGSELLS